MEAKIGKPIAEKGSLDGAAVLLASRESLQTLLSPLDIGKLPRGGRLCAVERLPAGDSNNASKSTGDGPDGLGGDAAPLLRRQAAICLVPEAMRKQLPPRGVVATRAFLAASGFREGDRVRITLEGEVLAPDAGVVAAVEHETAEHYASPPLPEDVPFWEWMLLQALREFLSYHDHGVV